MTREEAIKICAREKECTQRALGDCADGSGYVSPDGMITALDYVEALDMAIAALREREGKDTNVPTKWIGVDEKLPEKEKSVLILCKNKAVFTGYKFTDYCGDSRWRIHTALNSTKLLNKGRVTHWMPLPEPPEVEG